MSCNIFVIFLIFFANCCSHASRPLLQGSFSARSLEKHRKNGNAAVQSNSDSDINQDNESHFYQQTLDHFTFTPQIYDQTFQQRYLLDKKYWGGSQGNFPIFVFAGDEGDLVSDIHYLGFMTELAVHFQALLLYIEHRYYGLSMPFGSQEDSFKNATTLAYLTAEQALADYAVIIVDLKKNLSAQDCPVIVIGGSYGGMLAAWFRLKYPHIAVGALASSAPLLYFDNITSPDAFAEIVIKDFKNASETCYASIESSLAEIIKVGSTADGLKTLANIFDTCRVPESTDTLIDALWYAYDSAAQYNYQHVKGICEAIDGLSKGSYILTRISAGLTYFINSTEGNTNCFDLDSIINDNQGWQWQSCTEMVMPIRYTPNTTTYSRDCWKTYGILPRPNWITTEFGGNNMKRVLKSFGSNIIFSNGLRDPYSAGGVRESLSTSIVALAAEEGVHCQDLASSSSDDPQSVTEMRMKEIQIMEDWISQYKVDLLESANKSI
ncbi:hypothetical protein SUGI_0941410 [Cryptomeria japonica]|uniref:uncharacterized protein LOC131057850 n=1 Tax=Cryptomeria japonica TaxID=3369 RepID=UPI002414BA22|nr:uncharacterized protein LOC131057850 [Cryptomeria japonica]GLJ44762.1 hypothetical protein SUGI_0941410 [Cryptomeria japonica]